MLLHHLQDSFIFLALIALLLLLITHFICVRYFKEFPASPLSGSVIMAWALYITECLPQYQPNALVLRLLMLEVVVIWIYSSFSLLNNFVLTPPEERTPTRVGLSVWVIATALIAIMVDRIEPLQNGVVLLLATFAFLLWFKYIAIVSRVLLAHFTNYFSSEINTSLFLSAGGTASLAWMLYMIFQEKIPHSIYTFFILFACLLYVLIFAIWTIYSCRNKLQFLLENWNAKNSLIFGVSAVMGMSAIITQFSADWLVDALWLWTIIWGVLVTIFDIGMWCVHREISYDTRQWLRMFSYNMVFVFTYHYYYEHYSDNVIAVAIAEYALPVITVLYLLQLIYICIAARIAPHD